VTEIVIFEYSKLMWGGDRSRMSFCCLPLCW